MIDQLKFELEQVQKLHQEDVRSRDRRMATPSELLMKRSRSDSRMDVDEAPRATGHFNLEKNAHSRSHTILDRLGNEANQAALIGFYLAWFDSHFSQWRPWEPATSRPKELLEKLQEKTPESSTPEKTPAISRIHPQGVRSPPITKRL